MKLRGSTAQFVAMVEAANADAAVKQAVADHGITDPHTIVRLTAYPWS